MSKLPYMKWYPSDFDTDEVVRMMSFEQVGFYLVCLNHSWMNSGLPGDLESIAALFKVSRPDFDRLWHLVGRRFELVAGRYVNPRQEKERADANKKSESSRRSAQARWDQEQKNSAPLDANSMRTQCEFDANAMPRAYDSDSDSSSKENKDPDVSPPCIPDAGSELWAHTVYYRHPKKTDKREAITRLLKLGKDPALRKLIDRNHELWCKVPNWRKEQGRYAPKLFQWLDDEGYMTGPDLEEQRPEKRGIPAGAIE